MTGDALFHFSYTVFLCPFVFTACCMLISPSARRAVLRLPGFFVLNPRATQPRIQQPHLYSSRSLTARPFSQSRFNMLKKAVQTHESATVNKKLAQQLFSSSPPATTQAQSKSNSFCQPQSSRPLSVGSANVVRPGMFARTNGIGSLHPGVKRNASGLAKTISVQDGFDEPLYPHIGSQENSHLIQESFSKYSNTTGEDVYFDENDFDSDIDLDVEDPSMKGTVKYPDLPPPPPPSRTYMGQSEPGSTPADEQLPWSSSPLEHFVKPPSLRQFAYQGSHGTVSSRTPLATEQPRPSKRGTLPWLEEKHAHEENDMNEEASVKATPKYKRAKMDAAQSFFTPLPKNSQKASFPWNTTASAIKEQQKQLRQANKKIAVKNHDATEEDIQAAIVNKKKKQFHKVFLSEEQQHVLNLVIEQKKSVFFTGSAGTGKSVLLREIIAGLRSKFKREPDRIAVTASTGLAACNVGGVTLHSFAGIGLGKEDVPTLVKKIKRNQKARHRWMRTKVLIVDEISMVDGQLFDKLEEIARLLRNNGRPFGGIQLVITGDFFQLPPVPDYNTVAQFAFQAATWNTSIEHTIGLHHVFRQKDPGKSLRTHP
jgi:ATP-dependent DNA helicase PIF1